MALISVVLASMLLMALMVLTLDGQNRADTSSARDRNYDLALSVAESGVQRGIAKMQSSGGLYSGTFTGATPQGLYAVDVTKTPGRFVIQSAGRVGSDRVRRRRTVRVSMEPPASFGYAMFSNTSMKVKNNSSVTGDLWANDSVSLDANDVVDGSVTAARGFVDVSTATVKKNVWSGGYYAGGPWAIRLGNNARVDGWTKASVSAPNDPTTCGGELSSNYNVSTGAGSTLKDLTAWGEKTGSGAVQGFYAPHLCTEAATPKPLPPFKYNSGNYDPAGLREFGSVAAFQFWLSTNKTNVKGTFYVTDASPGQSNRIDLTGVTVTGDTTVITNAPIFSSGVADSGAAQRVFVLVSTYAPPAGVACDVNQDASECAIHLKNNFEPSCRTAVLVYANRGPAAVKNNLDMCGAIYADSVIVKNNQTLAYDRRIERIVGFGAATYEIRRWEERPAS